ncbi:MAG: CPBP family intramembrane metalloprotease [Chloroflexi bacterium]|nr:CPBP family intramembrane metalloprotease [Chloroflexota bacterium]
MALVALNNVVLLWDDHSAAGVIESPVGGVVQWGVVVGWSLLVARMSLKDVGLTLGNWQSGVGWGLGAGVAMAVPAWLFFFFPLIVPAPVNYEGYSGLGRGDAAGVVFVQLLVRTALLEETLFRGLIQQQGVQWLGAPRGIALSCALFVLWHVVIVSRTIEQTNLPSGPVPVPVLHLAAAAPVAAAGLIFSLIRYRTDSLVGPILAHWTVNTLIFLSFWGGS